MNTLANSNVVSDERLLNTRAWAAARVGSLSGAEVIVAAIDEVFARREEVAAYKAWAASCDASVPETTCKHGVLKDAVIPCDDCKGDLFETVAAIRHSCEVTKNHTTGCACSDCCSIRRAVKTTLPQEKP